MVPWLRFNLAETTSARPPQPQLRPCGGQAQQKPKSVKAPTVKVECEENPGQWKWQEVHHVGNRDSKNKFSRKLTWLRLRFQEISSWGRKFSLLWLEGHMANTILISLQSLISCFFETPMDRWAAVGATEGFWRGYSPVCPEGSIIFCALVAVAQAGGGSSVLNFLCAKDHANENCEHKSGI